MKTVRLKQPYSGYTTGTFTGKMDGYDRYEVILASGQHLYLYDFEFEEL